MIRAKLLTDGTAKQAEFERLFAKSKVEIAELELGLGITRAFAKAKYNVIFNGLEKDGNDTAAKVAREFQINYLFSP
ncbi:unnamed protein product, partial [Rotaria sp. Silwood1]